MRQRQSGPAGSAILASIVDYRHFAPNPLGHAAIDALGPALKGLGFGCQELRDGEFARPSMLQERVAALPPQTTQVAIFLSARTILHQGELCVLHPHSRQNRWKTYIPLQQMLAAIQLPTNVSAILLASLWLETAAHLEIVRQMALPAVNGLDVAVIGTAAGGQRFGRTGLPVVMNYVVKVLAHGHRCLARCTAHELVRLVEGGGMAFSDVCASSCFAVVARPVVLWNGQGTSVLPADVVRDLELHGEIGVVQDALQDLADYCHSRDAVERAEAAFRILTVAAAADEPTARLAGAVLRGQGIKRVAAPRSRAVPPPLIETVDVAAGEFVMGSNDVNRSEEKPTHRLLLPTYRIGRDPVTRAQFRAFLSATGYRFRLKNWRNPSGGPDLPADWIAYPDAVAFCEWLTESYRARGWIGADEEVAIPTEPEWEKAARGTDGRVYPWGNQFEVERCNSIASGHGRLTPVGSYSPQGDSPYGARDMAGNACEWTSSLWDRGRFTSAYRYPYDADDGREDEQAPDDVRRVVRGGAFYYLPDCVATTTRNRKLPALRQTAAGLRIVIRTIRIDRGR